MMGGVVGGMIAGKIAVVVTPVRMANVGHDCVVRRPVLKRNQCPKWYRRVVQRRKERLVPRNVASDEVGVRRFRTEHCAGVGSEALTETMHLDRGENLRRSVAPLPSVSLDEET